MSPTPNPNLMRNPELNQALIRLKDGTGTPDSIQRDFLTFRAAIVELETTATGQALETLGEYGDVLRGFARGYGNLRSMIDDASVNVFKPSPAEEPPA